MSTILNVFHAVFALLLIVLILMQKGKGSGMGAMAGMGGASQTLFGSRGSSSFITKLTSVIGFCFLAVCLGLGFYTRSSTEDVASLFKNSDTPVEQVEKQ